VVVNGFIATVRAISTSLVAAAAMFGVSPALANSSANADISAPLRAAQAAKPAAGGEEQFKQLFSSWQAIEKQQAPTANLAAASRIAPATSFGAKPFASTGVSIPSRMPVERVNLTSDYGTRIHPVLGGRRAHKGVDLAAPVGTPIYATADGVVGRADWFSSYGLYVSIEHGGNLQTRYGHMSRLNVAAGQQVRKGDIIGFVGSTGRSTGPHLHYEVRVAGEAVNPLPYLQMDSSH
jgi:murein DD-endopeptidase MepM/ murein hydrolase activator NlpD